MEYFENWPYFAWGIGAATTFYLVTSFATSFLHPDKKAHLSLWLQGDYESTWAAQFGAMFDRIFGEKHHYPRCIILSAIASVIAVFALWLLFDRILGLISLRANTGMTLTQALLLGAAINIIPDYISLYETRWLLKLFERIKNPIGQIGVLILDAAATGLIIYLGIKAYLWFTGTPQISAVEMMALFSIYAVFFYSTFLTSIWAWAYCLSSWLSILSARLRNWLDMREQPGRALALLGAAFVLIGAVVAKPALTMNEDGRIAMDDFLCDTFPASACMHVARLTQDEQEKLKYLGQACLGGVTKECFATAWEVQKVEPEEAIILWTKSCDSGDALGCNNLGTMYGKALGVDRDYARAADLYKQGCEGGSALGCTNLGFMYRKAQGVKQNNARALDLYKQGCDGGDARGCTNLGVMYDSAQGVDQDYGRALDLYKQGCDGGNALGCTNLGFMYDKAQGVEQDYVRAVNLYKQGCEDGNALGCNNLGSMYQNALGVKQDYARAVDLYKQGCDGGEARGCTNLGVMYERALGVDQDYARALDLYKQGCDGGNAQGCSNLGYMYDEALGVEQDYARALDLYKQGCDGGAGRGCTNLGWMSENALGVEKDLKKAEAFYIQGCDMGDDWACEKMESFKEVPK